MYSFTPYTINLSGKLIDIESPLVMGILNVTPDSFYADSRCRERDAIARRIEQIRDEGGSIIDIGGYSSRPGADDVSTEEEIERVLRGLTLARSIAPEMAVSVDTFRSAVVRECVKECGDIIVNDISGGTLDESMWSTVASLRLPYILMHMRGTPANMQSLTDYGTDDVVTAVIKSLEEKIAALTQLGVNDIIVDPGFGFGKTVEQNYALMHRLADFHALGMPILVGISRKSMIYKPLGITPQESLCGTTTLHSYALAQGAHILRVHDVRDAVQCVKITEMILNNKL